MNFLDPKTNKTFSKPTKKEAEEAVKVLLRWAGDDPSREGLQDTPRRVVKAYKEWFAGYDQDPKKLLSRTFKEVEGYSEIVTLGNIRFESFCEHHLAPIIGKAHVAYLPSSRIVGISKIARLVNAYSKRLQVQEKMTSQIANSLQEILKPKGVGVLLEGEHHCMCTRGVHKDSSKMVTSAFTGDFKDRAEIRDEFFRLINQ